MANLSFDVVALDRASKVFIDMAQQVERLSARIDKMDGQSATATANVDTKPAENALQRLLGQVPGTGGKIASGLAGGMDAKKGAVLAAGGALGAVLVTGLTNAIDVQAAQAKMAAQLGGSAEWAARAGSIAGSLYSQAYGSSLEEVNTAVVEVSRNIGETFMETDGDIEKTTAGVLNLASAFGVDLQAASTAVGSVMRNGLAPNTQAAMDVITVGFQQGVDKAGDFLEVLNEYSPQFAKFGMDAATATGIMSQGLRAGARDADSVADSIKEFSIRAIDGSKTTGEGFAALGLNAQDMASKFAAGGAGAGAALDLVFDRLRGMKDPVEQQAAAVALFGTKAEDLGASLFAIDPSSAVQALGDVGGAAAEMNDTLGDTAASKVESFKRTLEMGLVDVIGNKLLPAFEAVNGWGADLFGSAWEPVKSFLTWITGSGAVVGIIIGVVVAGVWAWTAAMAALSAASIPITGTVLVIAAGIAILIAAVIWAWNNFEGFRNVVMAVWAGIQVAFSVAWSVLSTVFNAIISAVVAVGGWFASAWSGIQTATSFLGSVIATVFGAVMTAINAVGAVVSWLWTTIIMPVFNFIAEAAKILLAVLVTIVLTPIMIAIALLGPVVMGLWTNFVQPAWQAIQDFISAAWNGVIKPVWDAIVNFLSAVLGTAFNAVRDLIVGVWTAIQTGINIAWAFIRDNIFTPVVNFLANTLGTAFTFYRDLAISVWNAIRDGINIAWAFIRDNIFTPVVNFLAATLGPAFTVARDLLIGAWEAIKGGLLVVWEFIRDKIWAPLVDFVTVDIPAAFDTAVGFIGRVWDTVKKAVRDPIDAVINVVYNNGIVKAWNMVAGLIGLDPLGEYHLPQFAEGGPVTKGSRAKKKDDVLARLSRGEHVWTDEEVAHAGGHNMVEKLRGHALNGQLPSVLKALETGTIVEGAEHTGPGVSTAGFGGVQPHVAQAGHTLGRMFGIGSIGGVGSRPNVSDHPAGLALDFMTRGENGTSLANHLFSQWGHYAVKYLIWRQRIANSPNSWQAMANRGGDTANHMDHVHVSFLGEGGVDDGGFSFDPVAWLMDIIGWFKDLSFPGGPPPWRDIPAKMTTKWIPGMWDFFLEKVKGFFGFGGGSGGASGDVVAAVRGVAAGFGWDQGVEWDSIDKIVMAESSWNPNATNGNAKGLFQKMTSLHGAVEPDAAGQARWGLNYIRGKYGTPSAAWTHHQRVGSYANGQVFTRPTFGLIGEAGPEVLMPLTRPQRAGSLARQAGLDGGGGDVLGTPGVEERLDKLIDTIERRGAGATIHVADRSGDPAETARRTVLALRLS